MESSGFYYSKDCIKFSSFVIHTQKNKYIGTGSLTWDYEFGDAATSECNTGSLIAKASKYTFFSPL